MQQKLRGLILKQRSIGENDRMLTVLTQAHGLVEVCAHGGKRAGKNGMGALQPLCYSDFCVHRTSRYTYVDSADLIYSFYDLRLDVVKLSLASYCCDLVRFLASTERTSAELLQLLLKVFYFLEQGKKEMLFLKAVFELKSAAIGGYMPDFVGCANCATFEADQIYFSVSRANFMCGKCFAALPPQEKPYYQSISPSVLQAMRHIIYSPFERLFSFQLGQSSLMVLSHLTEQYVLYHTDHTFSSLAMFHTMQS